MSPRDVHGPAQVGVGDSSDRCLVQANDDPEMRAVSPGQATICGAGGDPVTPEAGIGADWLVGGAPPGA